MVVEKAFKRSLSLCMIGIYALTIEKRGTLIGFVQSLPKLEIEIEVAKAIETTKANEVKTRMRDRAIKIIRILRGSFI